jgi:hypothetical protein
MATEKNNSMNTPTPINPAVTALVTVKIGEGELHQRYYRRYWGLTMTISKARVGRHWLR